MKNAVRGIITILLPVVDLTGSDLIELEGTGTVAVLDSGALQVDLADRPKRRDLATRRWRNLPGEEYHIIMAPGTWMSVQVST